jgi:hypothetical protein
MFKFLKRFGSGLRELLADSEPETIVTACDECDAPIPEKRRRHALRLGSEFFFCSTRCSARARKRRQRQRDATPGSVA